jgi:hypothetical protein
MRETRITLPELGLIAGTRAALGAGLGLLLADRLPEGQRRAVGWTLLLVGAVSTIPLAFEVFGASRLDSAREWPERATGDASHAPSKRFMQAGVSMPR